MTLRAIRGRFFVRKLLKKFPDTLQNFPKRFYCVYLIAPVSFVPPRARQSGATKTLLAALWGDAVLGTRFLWGDFCKSPPTPLQKLFEEGLLRLFVRTRLICSPSRG